MLLHARLTESELALWRLLREKPGGFAFKKQVQVGGFIADFLAPRALLIVEVDGDSHRGRERADARRVRKLARLGYRVLRLPAELVLREPAQALALLSAALARAG